MSKLAAIALGTAAFGSDATIIGRALELDSIGRIAAVGLLADPLAMAVLSVIIGLNVWTVARITARHFRPSEFYATYSREMIEELANRGGW